jgi:hypothetical protein
MGSLPRIDIPGSKNPSRRGTASSVLGRSRALASLSRRVTIRRVLVSTIEAELR